MQIVLYYKEKILKLLPENYYSSSMNLVNIAGFISVACPYTNNKISESEFKETIWFNITSKRIKDPGINLPKEAKHLYSENYKTLIKETEDNTNRWKYIPCSWFGWINIIKMTTQGNLLDSIQSPSNCQWHFLQI